MSHCPERGSEFIVGDKAHIYIYEQGGSATVAGIHPRVVRNQPDGSLAISDVIEAVREENPHFPVTRLVCIENTHNKCGGVVLSKEYIDELADAVHARGLKLHMDGARVMNACAALGISPKDLCAGCDSISLCLSKGLGAPLGSLLMGSKDFIARASRNRKVLGGAMRQNGVVAAMGLLCIEKYSGESMVQDHANLKRLATALAKLPGVEKLDLGACQSNMVYFDVAAPHDGASVKKALRDKGIIISGSAGSPTIRIVTHHQVRATDIDTVIDAMTEILS